MSRRTALNVALAVALAGLVGLHFALAPRPGERNFELLPEMVDSVPYDAFAPNPVFADGKTLQAPPEGTIPRGLLPLHLGPGPEEAARAGRELANPLALPAVLRVDAGPLPPPVAARLDEERAAYERALAKGGAAYAIYCALCHGPQGAGDGPVAKRGFPAPPSLLAADARAMPDGRMFHLITHGGENMPSYAVQMPREERWQTILHVRELQAANPAPPGADGTDPAEPAVEPPVPPQEVTAP